ncbi:Hsp20/alpha crystallin family protein [Patescibacteria group bacterium]|nr:Hsp20/alpha crystallin family protein [Patescibacteria group bacterium]
MSKKDKKEEEIEDEEEGDPIFNSDTQKIEHQVIVPEVEDDTDDAAPVPEEGDWLSDEFSGQLSVDVYQTDKEIVIKSTIAGVRSDDLDVQVTNDMVTIKGIRRMEEEVGDENYFYRECYWGKFSRSIILPVDVRNDQVTATVKNGVLTVRLPKTEPTKVSVVKVKE